MGIIIASFLDFNNAASPVRAASGTHPWQTKLTSRRYFPFGLWNKFEGEKKVCFRLSALAEIVKIVVALDRSVLRALKKGGIIK